MTLAVITWRSFIEPLALFGFAGQFVFMLRFVVQWYESERRKRSVVPVSFWYLSIGGGLIVFAYAAIREDPVIMTGQLMGLFIYVRNLILISRRKERVRERAAARAGSPDTAKNAALSMQPPEGRDPQEAVAARV